MQSSFPANRELTVKMSSKICFALVACVAMSSAQPVDQLPVLKDQPAEVLFRESKQAVLECVTEGGEQNVQYVWKKDGKDFNIQNAKVTQKKGEGSLVFNDPKAEDEGKYQCFAKTSAGLASTRVISFRRTFIELPTPVKTLEKKPVEGRPLQMECAVPKGYPTPTIVWKKQSSNGAFEPFSDRRSTTSPDGTLNFSNFTEEDVSAKPKFSCFASSPALDEEAQLLVYQINELTPDSKPKDGELVLQYASQDMIAKVGDVTMIYCVYGGTPLAHPDWFKDGKDVNGNSQDRVTRHNRSSGRRLLIKETWLEDQGTYVCDVNNAVGKPQKHSMKLTVIMAPKFETKPEKKMMVSQGKSVTIPCKVSGLPEPKVAYTFNGQLLNGKAEVTEAGLVIKSAKKADSGYYGCRAVNEYGDEYVETLVHVA